MRAPYDAYRSYEKGLIADLVTQVSQLSAGLAPPISADTLANARVAWQTAHHTWLQLGEDNGAYGAYGRLGGKIDGTSAGLPGGVDDPAFTGFHKVELDLWTRKDATAAAADEVDLVSAVNRLAAHPISYWFPRTIAAESSWILRSHEVLEDALRDALSGADDYGSGSALSDVTSDITVTQVDLNLLKPLIDPRRHHLVARGRAALARLVDVVDSTEVGGTLPSLDALTSTQRAQINGALGAALETLADVPAVLQIGGNAT
jgi:iron uptake system EfeUOB component EfeO/EfeM